MAAEPLAKMLLEWNTKYAAALSNADPSGPSKDSIERVLVGTFALRGWIPYVIRNI